MSRPLTDQTWLQRSVREEAVEKVQKQDPTVGKWLKDLLDREKVLETEGNAYGEVYSGRQVSLAIGAVMERETMRARILELAREKSMTLIELAEALDEPASLVLGHIVALRRRTTIQVEKMDGNIPVYRAAALKVEE